MKFGLMAPPRLDAVEAGQFAAELGRLVENRGFSNRARRCGEYAEVIRTLRNEPVSHSGNGQVAFGKVESQTESNTNDGVKVLVAYSWVADRRARRLEIFHEGFIQPLSS